MLKIEFVDSNLEVLRVQFWDCDAVPRTGDKVFLREESKMEVSDGQYRHRRNPSILGKVDWVLWLGDGEIQVCVV